MSSLTFTFCYSNNTVRLKVWNRYGKVYEWNYPLTYTIQECLEDFCDSWGYRFVSHVVTDTTTVGLAGMFNFVTPGAKIVFSGDITGRVRDTIMRTTV